MIALLENDHIRLRALEPEDLMLLYRWENNSELWSVSNTLAPYSLYALKEYIAESRKDIYELKQLRLIIEECPEGRAIGTIDLFDFDAHNKRAGVGILLDPAFQGGGRATEALALLTEYAFSFLKLHQLYVHIPTDNESSKALFTRGGFLPAGVLVDWLSVAATSNAYRDVLVMQLIR
ncbi:Spermidine N(1)-acetyltransferase [Bacteroidales bacterium Barb4]|nr:Spermidine N(1)-acetyltransferase [Bacteroidales bacterium Barb4]